MTPAARAIWGADFGRTLAEQAVRGRASLRQRGLVGPTDQRWGYTRPLDRQAAARAARSFGLSGGELCGCHVRGCRTCACSGGCGESACGQCAPFLAHHRQPTQGRRVPASRMASGGAGVGLGAWKGTPNRPDGQLGDFEVEDTLAWVFSGPVIPDRLPRPDTAGLGIDLGFRYDAHAHHFASANAADEATAATRWVDMETVVDASVLMGSIDGFADTGDKLKSSDSVNDAMFTVAATLPDFFAPFCHIVPAEHKDPAAAAEVTRCVGLGARGVGELYVHAHGEDTDSDDETEAFYDIFRTAAAEGVPVAVHWDIGNTEDSGSTSDYVQRDPADNFSQLTALLDMLSAEGNLPDIILCHCGAGPGGRDDEIAVDLETRLAELLTYSNVYFDIAGMQLPADGSGVREGVERLGDSSSGITALGQMIRDLIQDWPTRFLFGTDADDREDVDTADSFGVPSYIASVEGYPEFLDLPDSSGASLTKFNVARVMGRNLRRLIGVP